MVKLCSGCKENKATSEFHKRIASIDGLHSRCKNCRSQDKSVSGYRKNTNNKRKKVLRSDAIERAVRILYGATIRRIRVRWPHQLPTLKYKRCTCCNENKPESEFGIRVGTSKQSACKKCRNIRTVELWDRGKKDKANLRLRHRRATSPQFKLNEYTSNGIYQSLRRSKTNGKAGRHWETLVNYTGCKLREHLESQFRPEMNWQNHGIYWEIDHIRPRASFNYEQAEDPEFQECWALENLQPLTVAENRSKSDKLDWEQ